MKARFTDWPSRFEAEVRKRARTRLKWGYHDCCLAAVACARAMTGDDLARGLRGYTTRAGAEAMIAAHGGFLPMLRAVAARHKLEEVAPAFAQRGDLIYYAAADGEGLPLEFLGVLWLDGKSAFIADCRGWDQVALADCSAAWRIG